MINSHIAIARNPLTNIHGTIPLSILHPSLDNTSLPVSSPVMQPTEIEVGEPFGLSWIGGNDDDGRWEGQRYGFEGDGRRGVQPELGEQAQRTYRAILDYDPRMEDEMQIRVGDLITLA